MDFIKLKIFVQILFREVILKYIMSKSKLGLLSVFLDSKNNEDLNSHFNNKSVLIKKSVSNML